MVRLTDRPDMTLDVYRGRKTTIQQIPQVDEWCSVLTGLAFLSSSDELERSSSPGPEVIKLNGPVLAQVLYVSCSISCSTLSMKTFSKVL